VSPRGETDGDAQYEKVGEARAGVDAKIDEWVRATQALAEGSSERRRGAVRVADAWGLYAQLEMELRQFKQATKVFESAVSCAVTRDATALWLQYAAFCVDRKKLSNARKVFARAIFAVPVRAPPCG
jgi:tetratricopeptide (TPR) repeat protein